jgi:hypothetical protein
MTAQRIRELIAPLGFDGGKTIVDDYVREVRPPFVTPGTYQRTVIGPGRSVSSISGSRARRFRSVTARRAARGSWLRVWAIRRAGAGALLFFTQTADLLFGIRRCLWSLGALPRTLVWDRQSRLHAGGGGRPTVEFAACCGRAAGRLAFLRAARSAGQRLRRAPAGLPGARPPPARRTPLCARPRAPTRHNTPPRRRARGERRCRVAGAVARPGSHRTVLALFADGSSGRRVANPAAGRFATSIYPCSRAMVGRAGALMAGRRWPCCSSRAGASEARLGTTACCRGAWASGQAAVLDPGR